MRHNFNNLRLKFDKQTVIDGFITRHFPRAFFAGNMKTLHDEQKNP